MSQNKHTPGPWHVQDDHGRRWIETNGNDDTIAEIHRRKAKGSVYSCGEASANAHLIAAAPDLLEAASHVLSILDHESRSVTALDADRLRDAIAKARGDQP